ncbi:NAD(P)/FAD-dependent oxidoreductase [Nocardioides insulae]|uniref:NAD(P)/FAD-dependent oxidoreductase n=1 Tax=Nocardioides insulae TaxID=394734 RepID=UPI0003FEF1C6|nr:FAD-dependent oxidoreductase [Nocardioides insulae]
MRRNTVAVVGAGVAGLTAAHVLASRRAVTLFEAENRLGGHAHTHDVSVADGRTVAVDSGFIVHNERTYPQLLRLFAELGVETRPTEMSMSITCDTCGLSYAGGRGVSGILAQPWRAADPRFLRLLAEVPRFHRAARRLLAADGAETTWGRFLGDGGYSEHFVRHFAVPLVSCVWSSGERDALAYPARHLFAFLDHHGMLGVRGSPTWRTVVGGSRSYVERLAERLPDVRREEPVCALTRHSDGVDVRTGDGRIETFDQVVIATHADQALAILADATPGEKQDLGAITYSVNRTLLHRDSSLLPPQRAARASWNHRTTCGRSRPAGDDVTVSYWMNRLHGLQHAEDLVVTLNGTALVDPAAVVAEMTYRHPVFTAEAVAAAQRLRAAGGDRLAFAGAHLGWGFHEDGCRSGVEAAAALGVAW